jgi:hypothetical protein
MIASAVLYLRTEADSIRVDSSRRMHHIRHAEKDWL